MSILIRAKELVDGDRRKDYGDAKKSCVTIAKLWSLILDIHIYPEQVPLCMIALKLAREIANHNEDNIVDIAGYAEIYSQVKDSK